MKAIMFVGSWKGKKTQSWEHKYVYMYLINGEVFFLIFVLVTGVRPVQMSLCWTWWKKKNKWYNTAAPSLSLIVQKTRDHVLHGCGIPNLTSSGKCVCLCVWKEQVSDSIGFNLTFQSTLTEGQLCFSLQNLIEWGGG